MKSYARWLFALAAAFNVFIGLSLIFLRPLLEPALDLEPLTGTGLMFSTLTGLLVCVMGCVYGLISVDPVRYRPFIVLGAIGKLLGSVCMVWPRLGAPMPETFPALVAGDLVYAVLFIHYLWLTRSGRH